MPTFISRILQGVREWVKATLSEMSFVIANHIAVVDEKLAEIAFDELDYSEYALYTQKSSNIKANGLVSKVGHTVTLQIYNATTVDGWTDICYRLPYVPDSSYLPVVNSRGVYESNGIHYYVTIQYKNVDGVVYPALVLNHYVSGQGVMPWEYGQNVTFKVDYITAE